MSENISISEARHEDLPEIIALTCRALEPDPIWQFLFSPRSAEAIEMQTASLTKSLGARFTSPTNRCYIHKAVDTSTTQIVGWSLVRWEDGSWPGTPVTATDESFTTNYTKALKKKWLNILGDKKPHVVLGALHVRPDRQRQGIGKMLVGFLDATYDLNRELVVLQTNPMSEGFYQRLGWVTADATETDLSDWAGKGKGYGIRRAPQMLRHPQTSQD